MDVSNYPEYQVYPDTDGQVVYHEVNNDLYDQYQTYPEYQNTQAVHHQEFPQPSPVYDGQDRYQTNYGDYPVLQSRADTGIVETSTFERLWNRISSFMKNFVHNLEEKSRSDNTDRIMTIVTVTSLIIGSILAF